MFVVFAIWILQAIGVNHAVTIDIHAGQIQGFFPPSVPVDNVSATVVVSYQ
jgi:phosphoribosylpyrophosphate synthetase